MVKVSRLVLLVHTSEVKDLPHIGGVFFILLQSGGYILEYTSQERLVIGVFRSDMFCVKEYGCVIKNG